VKRMTEKKIDFDGLSKGYTFRPARLQLDDKSVSAYLDAVEGDRTIYKETGTVPPMAIAALAMTAMAEGLSMPPGAIHVSQELRFIKPVLAGENLTSHARVNRKIQRGRINMLSIGIDVRDDNNTSVLTGETSFILPLAEEE
jgi:acyl dehydratase